MTLRTDLTNSTPQADTHPDQHNEAHTMILANQLAVALLSNDVSTIETQLGTNPQGIYADVNTRIGTAEFTRAQRGVGFVSHGSNAATARPTAGFAIYIWFGTVQPNNWTDGDIYVDLSP